MLRCPTEMSSHVYTITDLGLTYAKYDPNLNDDLDDDDEEEIGQDVEMETEDEEEEDEDEGCVWLIKQAFDFFFMYDLLM